MRNAFQSMSVALVGLAAVCADPAGVEAGRGITVIVMATEPAGTSAAPGAVEIDGVRLVLGGVKLETAGMDGTVDWVFDQSVVIEVDLTGEPVTAQTLLDVPPGTYKEIEISIDKLEPGNPAETALLAEHPDLTDASIVITADVLQDGTAVPFVFVAALDRDMEIQLQPHLVLNDDGGPAGIQVTLYLNLDGWFRGPEGQWLDPRDPANRSTIEANIQASLAAFEDGNGDGVPGPIVR